MSLLILILAKVRWPCSSSTLGKLGEGQMRMLPPLWLFSGSKMTPSKMVQNGTQVLVALFYINRKRTNSKRSRINLAQQQELSTRKTHEWEGSFSFLGFLGLLRKPNAWNHSDRSRQMSPVSLQHLSAQLLIFSLLSRRQVSLLPLDTPGKEEWFPHSMIGSQLKWQRLSSGPTPAVPSLISTPTGTTWLRPSVVSAYSDEDQLLSEGKRGSKMSASDGQSSVLLGGWMELKFLIWESTQKKPITQCPSSIPAGYKCWSI